MPEMTTQSPRASLVESIPVGLESLRDTPRIQYTADVLVRLTLAAQSTIDLTAMYWALLPDPKGSDEQGFTDEQFRQMGADSGRALYAALCDAANRGVSIRILQSPGFSGERQESDNIREQFPKQVSIHEIDMSKWYGGGIMHQKIWIFDSVHIYLGSANMDWKSLTQVKEMGVVVEDCQELAADAIKYFDSWWAFSALSPATQDAFDPVARIDRRVPSWSSLVEASTRSQSPLADKYATEYCAHTPLQLELNGKQCGVFLSGCPQEVLGNARTWDGEGLVHTIDDAQKSVCISVMDFARPNEGPPIGAEGRIPTDTPVWWPLLTNPLLSAVLTHKLYVRLLVSKWAHTSPLIEPMLRALQSAADAGRADPYMSSGQLEIKLFMVPGWNSTTGSNRKYPGHTRVNHTKYVVTDRRINIGTSNMTWDYFASTAGSSFNTDQPELVRTLQAVFDRDWASSYAWRLS